MAQLLTAKLYTHERGTMICAVESETPMLLVECVWYSKGMGDVERLSWMAEGVSEYRGVSRYFNECQGLYTRQWVLLTLGRPRCHARLRHLAGNTS